MCFMMSKVRQKCKTCTTHQEADAYTVRVLLYPLNWKTLVVWTCPTCGIEDAVAVSNELAGDVLSAGAELSLAGNE